MSSVDLELRSPREHCRVASLDLGSEKDSDEDIPALIRGQDGEHKGMGAMHETPNEVTGLQDLLDRSYAAAGTHLASIHTAKARLTAEELIAQLVGMQVFVVATTTRDGRPRTGPVDCFLFRGTFRFGTASNSLRARHLAQSPAVSATHVRGETLVVTVHGTAELLDLNGRDRGFRDFLGDHYGTDHFDQYLDNEPYYRILPHRLFAADMSVHRL